MKKFMFPVNLQYFADELEVSDTSEPVESVESDGVAPTPAEEEPPTVETDPNAGVEQSKAFAKRLAERTNAKLAEERAKWEAEQAERYREYEQYRTLADQLLKYSGHEDIHTLQSTIEQQLLEAQAQQNNVPVEVMQRLNELERRAQRADELERQWQSQQAISTFYRDLDQFIQGKEDVTSEAMIDFMLQSGITNFDAAYKALRAEQLEQKLATAKEDAIREYLESKKAPKVEGAGSAPGLVAEQPAKTWEEARERALARLRSITQQ